MQEPLNLVKVVLSMSRQAHRTCEVADAFFKFVFLPHGACSPTLPLLPQPILVLMDNAAAATIRDLYNGNECPELSASAQV